MLRCIISAIYFATICVPSLSFRPTITMIRQNKDISQPPLQLWVFISLSYRQWYVYKGICYNLMIPLKGRVVAPRFLFLWPAPWNVEPPQIGKWRKEKYRSISIMNKDTKILLISNPDPEILNNDKNVLPIWTYLRYTKLT